MMKKMTAILLTVICLFTAIAGLADAEEWTCEACGTANTGNFCSNCGAARASGEWVCPSCGTKNSGKFCSNCGTQKPSDTAAAVSTIKNVKCTTSEGNTTITWEDSTKGPWEVNFTTAQWEDYSTHYDCTDLTRKKASTFYLIPGETYMISVSNGQTESEPIEYRVPKSAFSEFTPTTAMTMSPNSFNLSGDNYYSSFRFNLNYPRLARNRVYDWLLALKTPLGYASIVYPWDEMELDRNYSGYYWDWAISDYMDSVKTNFGKIPSGEYTFESYFSGRYYGSVTFHVYAP